MASTQAELDCRDSPSLYFSFTHVAAVTVLMLMMHDAAHAEVDASWMRARCIVEAEHCLSHDQEANGVALTIPVTVLTVTVAIAVVVTISVVVEIAVTQMSYNRLKIKDGFL